MATRVVEGDFGVILSRTTARSDGDFAIDGDPAGLEARRRAVADHRWVWLRQVHGAEVVVVTAENVGEVTGLEADALVTAEPDLVLAVQTADCVPVTFSSRAGVIGVAHAGWRGLEAGVIERTVEAMRTLGAESPSAVIGPHIQGECYEFGTVELDRLSTRFGDEVRTTTSDGRPGLDLTAMTRLALAGVDPVEWRRGCTACRPDRWYSHRARGESQRMATVIWRESPHDHAVVAG